MNPALSKDPAPAGVAYTKFSVRIPTDLWAAFKRKCYNEDRDGAKVLRRLIREWMGAGAKQNTPAPP